MTKRIYYRCIRLFRSSHAVICRIFINIHTGVNLAFLRCICDYRIKAGYGVRPKKRK